MNHVQKKSTSIHVTFALLTLGVLSLTACGTPQSEAGKPENYVIGSMAPGPHFVGFKAYHETNYADTFGPMWSDQGELITGESPRPVQISVWYPAAGPASGEPLRTRDYVALDATRTEFRTVGEAERAAFIQEFISGVWSIIPPHTDLVEKHLDMATTAFADAPPAAGPFPLVIIATHLNTSPWENAVLAEYLASNGYIVVATTAKGMQELGDAPFGSAAPDMETIMATLRDMQFVKGFMRNFESFDGENVVVIGERTGGWAAALLANRDPQVRALVLFAPSLDPGSVDEIFGKESSLNPDVFRSPLLHVSGATQGRGEPATFPFGDEIPYADVYHARVTGLERLSAYSSSRILLYLKTTRHDPFMGLPGVEIGYELGVQAVKNFLDGVFEGSSGAEMVSADLDQEAISVDYTAAFTSPPTAAGLFDIFREQGAEVAQVLLQQVRNDNPDYLLFSLSEALAFATELRNGGLYDQYLAFTGFVESLYPENAVSFYLRGEALMLLKRNDEARIALQRMQQLKPPGNIAFLAGGLLKELGIRPEGQQVEPVPITFTTRSMEGKYPFAQPYNHPSRFSPDREARAEIGGAELVIEYGSPRVRGRRVLDELVPTHSAWRTGANEATVFTCRTDLLVQGEPLPAGSYALFTIGGGEEWTIIFNRVNQQWGAFTYDPIHDQLRVRAPVKHGEHMEDFTISIEEVDEAGAEVVLAWGEYRVPFRIAAVQ